MLDVGVTTLTRPALGEKQNSLRESGDLGICGKYDIPR